MVERVFSRLMMVTASQLFAACFMLMVPGGARGQDAEAPATPDADGRPSVQLVLYRGPLAHDANWRIRRGTTNNQIHWLFGGTCSLVPSDVREVPGSTEQVTFEATHLGLGVWRVEWRDIVTGRAVANSGARYRYWYMQRWRYDGTTKDGRRPDPSRALPATNDPGFMRAVPNNTVADAIEFHDFFRLVEEDGGKLVANSHVFWTLRLPNSPSEQPPPFFPVPIDGYIVENHEQLAGQLGCDPL